MHYRRDQMAGLLGYDGAGARLIPQFPGSLLPQGWRTQPSLRLGAGAGHRVRPKWAGSPGGPTFSPLEAARAALAHPVDRGRSGPLGDPCGGEPARHVPLPHLLSGRRHVHPCFRDPSQIRERIGG